MSQSNSVTTPCAVPFGETSTTEKSAPTTPQRSWPISQGKCVFVRAHYKWHHVRPWSFKDAWQSGANRAAFPQFPTPSVAASPYRKERARAPCCFNYPVYKGHRTALPLTTFFIRFLIRRLAKMVRCLAPRCAARSRHRRLEPFR